MDRVTSTSLKPSAFAALALAFASFGDAFLYPFLPVNFQQVGIPVVWVGLILSVNRFIRIFSNAFVVDVFSKFGIRRVMIFSVALAITSTLGYAVASGLLTWLVLRIIWGLSFSALRIGSLGYALVSRPSGYALGISRGFQELGPMITLGLAPIFLQHFGSATIFFLLAACSIPGIYFAFRLPEIAYEHHPVKRSWFRWPSNLNALTFTSALVIDGVIIVVLAVLFLDSPGGITPPIAASLAALYLGYRRICLVLLSLAGGWLSDRVGLNRVFNTSLVFMVIGLTLIAIGWLATGVVIVFTFYSIYSAITPGSFSGSQFSLHEVAENATWRDLGAATGTLLGGLLISSDHLPAFFSIAIMLMLTLLLIRLLADRTTVKLFSYGSNNHL